MAPLLVLDLTYLVGLERVEEHLEAHRAYLRRGYAAGVFLASGPKEPRTGGVILARGERAALEALVVTDPFVVHGVARYDITPFHPTMTADDLAHLREPAAPSRPGVPHRATPADLAGYRDELVRACREQDGVTSLVLFGSSSGDEAGRRDEWSDLDFTVFFAPDAAPRLRADWPFLPRPDGIAVGAREGHDGGVVLYDDGMLLEFGAGVPWQLADPAREVVLDGGDLSFVDPPSPPDPANAVRLFLVKLYIGVGRYRRGERVAASAHVRTYATAHLAWALVLRLTAAPLPPSASPFDPLRRLETTLPDVGNRLADLLDADLETCARGLLALARTTLETDWPDFPTRGADVVACRLGWAD